MRGATVPADWLGRKSQNFNPRAPCGARHDIHRVNLLIRQFQSTRPMRGATFQVVPRIPGSISDFNPRAPCGARRFRVITELKELMISIHAPHAGRDLIVHEQNPHTLVISIHAPHAGRDLSQYEYHHHEGISIHAPHAGRDELSPLCDNLPYNFNPRAPCGARLLQSGYQSQPEKFQSTRPMRGATGNLLTDELLTSISIHAPHAGRDFSPDMNARCLTNFNPRAPCGARRLALGTDSGGGHISIHAPHAGRDHLPGAGDLPAGISIHAPHAGRDRAV